MSALNESERKSLQRQLYRKSQFWKKNQSETDVYSDIPAKRPKWPRMQRFVRFNEEKKNHASAWIE